MQSGKLTTFPQKLENLGIVIEQTDKRRNKYKVSNNEGKSFEMSIDEYAIRFLCKDDTEHYTPINYFYKEGTVEINQYTGQPEKEKYVQYMLLQDIINLGLVQEKSISIEEIKQYVKDNEVSLQEENKKDEIVKDIIKQHGGSVEKLQNAESININPNKTDIIIQGDAIILKNPSPGDSLYTFGAGPCVIIIIRDPDTGQIGLAHIDSLTTVQSIKGFVTQSGFDDNSKITIIGGEQRTIKDILLNFDTNPKVSDRIDFIDIEGDKYGERVDAAGIVIDDNNKPIIYYGNNQSLINKVIGDKSLEMKLMMKGMQLQKMPLHTTTKD